MTIQRVSTYAIHQSTLGDVGRVQSNLANLQGQISSGKKTSNFEGLGNQVEHFIALEHKIAKATTYVNNNNLITARLNTTQTVMEDVIGVVDDMEDLILLRRGAGNGDALNFRQQMLSMQERLSEMVNTTFEGRYIFGGTRTNAPPMPTHPTTITPGVPDNSYYNGSSEDVFARLDDNIEVNYGVRGDHEGFQKVVAAMTQALNVQDGDTGSDPALGRAFEMIQDGLQDLISEQTRVNSNIVAVQNITARHENLNLYWQGVKDTVINTDIVAASTQVAVDQTVLQASFQSFSTLNRLRLVDFL